VELLSREGEIAIAKRIEAGRDIMIWGLCESPITFNAIIGWSNALNEGRMQLREILDLEAMLSKGPTAEQIAATEEGGEGGGGGEEVPEAARAADRRGRKRPVPRQQDRGAGRRALRLQPQADRAWRADASPRRAPQGAAPRLPRKLHGPRARRDLARRRPWDRQEMGRVRHCREGDGRAHPQ